MLAASVATASAQVYEMQWFINGLQPGVANTPAPGGEDPSPGPGADPEDEVVSWSLESGPIPRAIYNQPYAYDLNQTVTPFGVEGISWQATNLPEWLSLDGLTGVLTGHPELSFAGNYSFNVEASRGTDSYPSSYSITVGGEVLEAVQVSSGLGHTCAVTRSGELKCWGAGNHGRLGHGGTNNLRVPGPVAILGNDVASVSAGSMHTCAVTTGGALYCWGRNQYGQLGDGTAQDRLIPTMVLGLSSGVVSVSAGNDHTCAMMATGAVQCWGSNQYGQLGTGNNINRTSPTPVVNLSPGAKQISVGQSFSCAVLNDGSARCWGWNGNGQLGDGTTTLSNSPVEVSVLGNNVAKIDASLHSTCAVTVSGGAYCWGSGTSGNLGDGGKSNRTRPVPVLDLTSGVTDITGGGAYTCATTSSEIYCWGSGSYGKLGTGNYERVTKPVLIAGDLGGAVSITAGLTHACAVAKNGETHCWGDNTSHRLGLGTLQPTDSPTPLEVPKGN